MVIMVIPPDISKMMDEVKGDLKREIIKIAMKHGVPFKLVDDSQAIGDSVNNITNKIVGLRQTLLWQGTDTNFLSMDGVYFKPIKKTKYNKDIEKTIKEFKSMDGWEIKEDESLLKRKNVKKK